MDDVREIERLIAGYAERVDAGDFAGLGALLAYAVVKAGGRTVADRDAKAVERLYETTTRRYEDGTPRTKHVVTNVVVEVDGRAGSAEARSYFTVLQQLDDFPLQIVVAGRYHDRFERAGGIWRFSEREILMDLVGDLTRHLLIDLPHT